MDFYKNSYLFKQMLKLRKLSLNFEFTNGGRIFVVLFTILAVENERAHQEAIPSYSRINIALFLLLLWKNKSVLQL
jgi:hypothetical protein